MKSLLVSIVVAIVCFAAKDSNAQATPNDVYQRLLEIAAEVDLIRLEMGVADTAKPEMAVSGAQPREVYFQALTLYEKANRMLFEQLREREDAPERALGDVTPDAVLLLADRTFEIVLRVKQSLGIVETAVVQASAQNRSPTDVYKLIIQVNRLLNTLLQERFAPADVYQQLTYGVGLASRILATSNSAERLGTEAALVRRKTPLDVYRKLITIYSVLRETMQLSGEVCLVIEPFESERIDVNPSDVYDLASLLVAELTYLHSLSPDAAVPKESYYPGDKLPAHVYQRAGRLESQMAILHNHASSHPDWLKRK